MGTVVTMARPRLALEVGDTDWFRLESAATGTLTVNLLSGDHPEQITLQVLDSDGQQVVGTGELMRDALGNVIGRQVRVPSSAGQFFAIRVASPDSTAAYELEVKSLTEDLGTLVQHDLLGALASNDQAYYLFKSAAAGVISAVLTPVGDSQGDVRVELLDPRDLEVLATRDGVSPQLRLQVKAGQSLLLRVTGADSPAVAFSGSYRLELSNLDQYSSAQQSLLQFPAGVGPSQMAIGDFNQDQFVDVAVTNTGANTVSVMLGNGDGTFSAARQWSVGAFQTPNPVGDDANLVTYRRDILTADFNHDGLLDLVVTNYDSADVSLLLGRGDGTFQPQRRFDAAAFPIGVTSGDVNRDGQLDLVVIDSPEINIPNKLAVLLGRGDGTFQPQKIQELPNILFLAVVALGDFDKDGILDLVAGGGINDGLDIFRGVGDGSFVFTGRVPGSRQAASLAIADLDGDGNLDVVAPSLSDHNAVTILYGTGDLKFSEPIEISDVGQGPLAIQVADWGDQTSPPDGLLDILVANSGVIPGPFNAIGPPGVVLLPGMMDGETSRLGFGDPITLAPAEQPLDLEVADFDGDQSLDIAVVDRDGFFVIFGRPTQIRPNTTRTAARDLGIVVHTVQPTLTLLPDHPDAWFRMQVPVESLRGAGDQVIDISANFAHVTGAGLQLEVIDATGKQRGVGDRVRVVARQGETLFLHIESLTDGDGLFGTGAYTLQIVTLPQLVDVQAPALLPGKSGHPGGPITGLVLSFQGGRLDPASAQDPANYRVTWLGRDGLEDTGDDRDFVVGGNIPGGMSVVYNPSANRDVSSGRTYPTAVRQTVSLLFAEGLPAGAYRVQVSADVQVAPYASDRAVAITTGDRFITQGVVSHVGDQVELGARRTIDGLIPAPGTLGGFDQFASGTRFLTQLHSDLGALLDRILTDFGDRIEKNTETLLNQIVARLDGALGPLDQRLASILVVLLDPVSISLLDPGGRSFGYDLQRNTVANGLVNSFVEVGGNVELVILAQPSGIFQLNIADVPPLARGGWAHLGQNGNQTVILTEAMRSGDRSFLLGVGSVSPAAALVPVITPQVVPVTLSMMSRAGLSSMSEMVRSARSTEAIGSFPRSPNDLIRNDALLESMSPAQDRTDRWNQLLEQWMDFGRQLRSRLMKSSQAFRKGALLLQAIPWDWLQASLQAKSSDSRLDRGNTTAAPSSVRVPIDRARDQSRTRVRRDPSRAADGSFESSFAIKTSLSSPRHSYESNLREPGSVRAVATLPEDAGQDANRKQVSREDRRFGHRPADNVGSAPRDQTVSR